MRGAGALGLTILALIPATARAGAWPLDPGRTQAILKYEGADASEGYDPHGNAVAIPKLNETDLSLFVEHGITSRLTLQAKLGYTEGQDQFVRYSGRAPIELGLRWTAICTSRSVVSLYVAGIAAGEGRNAGYAKPKLGDGDVEVRLLAGRSGKWRKHDTFAELQVARRFRSGLPDETRVDFTSGLYLTPKWLVLLQTYAGQADARPVSPQWVKAEASIVRHLGPWSVQAGWRQTTYGRETPIESGPVIGLWRRL